MSRPFFAPGFRLSYFDVAVLIVGGALGVGLVMVSAAAAFVVLFVVGHFFLFCNVFRVSRGLELAWSGLFALLAGATMTSGYPGWLFTAGLALAATSAVIALEMRKPSYHGVLWQRVNPRLREWWEASFEE